MVIYSSNYHKSVSRTGWEAVCSYNCSIRCYNCVFILPPAHTNQFPQFNFYNLSITAINQQQKGKNSTHPTTNAPFLVKKRCLQHSNTLPISTLIINNNVVKNKRLYQITIKRWSEKNNRWFINQQNEGNNHKLSNCNNKTTRYHRHHHHQ